MTLKSFLTVLLMPQVGPLGKQKPPKISSKCESFLPCLQQPDWQLSALFPAGVPSSWPVQLSLGTVAAAGVGSGDLSKCQLEMSCYGKELKMLNPVFLSVYPQLPSLSWVGIFRTR